MGVVCHATTRPPPQTHQLSPRLKKSTSFCPIPTESCGLAAAARLAAAASGTGPGAPPPPTSMVNTARAATPRLAEVSLERCAAATGMRRWLSPDTAPKCMEVRESLVALVSPRDKAPWMTRAASPSRCTARATVSLERGAAPNNGMRRPSPRAAFASLTGASALSRRQPPFKSLPSAIFGGRYVAGRYLGRGASATVWQATHSDRDFCVAVKVFDQGSRDKRQAHREAKVLSRVQHPSVLEAFEVIETPLCSHLICELVDGESLRSFTQRQPQHRLEEGPARHFYRQVVEGVSYCHDHLVVHRDLKLENLLLDSCCEHVKIIDFGFATQVVSKETKLRAFCGTPSYMAPEIVRGDGYSGFATDVWALGVVIFALLAGALPFVGRTEMQLYAKIRRGVFTYPDIMGDSARRLVRAALRLDAAARPSASAVLRQSWVRDISPPPAGGGDGDAAVYGTSLRTFRESSSDRRHPKLEDKEGLESPCMGRRSTLQRRSLGGSQVSTTALGGS